MKLFRYCREFFIYSNLFIAACATLMCSQVYLLFTNQPIPFPYPAFVFFSTLCSYSFHWYFTSHSAVPSPRINWLHRFRQVHLVFFFAGLAGAAWYFLYFSEHWLAVAGAGLATFLYTAPKLPNQHLRQLRKVALGKTIFLAAVWTYVTTVLPVIVAGDNWSVPHTLFSISRYFMIYAICILFDYRDREDDKEAGIRSLITYLSERNIRRLFVFSLLVYILASCLLTGYGTSIPDVLIILAPALPVALLFKRASHDFGDMLYYFVLDGLMAISSLLTLFTRI